MPPAKLRLARAIKRAASKAFDAALEPLRPLEGTCEEGARNGFACAPLRQILPLRAAEYDPAPLKSDFFANLWSPPKALHGDALGFARVA